MRRLAALAALAGLALAYPRLLRPWLLSWGASDEEAAAALPGDSLLADPDRVSTRAITIATLPMEAGSLVMERKMLQGIRRRAERVGRDGGVGWERL